MANSCTHLFTYCVWNSFFKVKDVFYLYFSGFWGFTQLGSGLLLTAPELLLLVLGELCGVEGFAHAKQRPPPQSHIPGSWGELLH